MNEIIKGSGLPGETIRFGAGLLLSFPISISPSTSDEQNQISVKS
jgi:hypothetical protein